MADLFQVDFIGRLTKPVEIKDPENGGTTFAYTSLAMNRKINGEEQTEYVDVKFFGKTAETAFDHLTTGDEVFVKGNAMTRYFEKKVKTEGHALAITVNTLAILKCKKSSEGKGNGNGQQRDEDDDPPRRGSTSRPSNGRTQSRYGSPSAHVP